MTQVTSNPDRSQSNADQTPRCVPSPFLGGGEKEPECDEFLSLHR